MSEPAAKVAENGAPAWRLSAATETRLDTVLHAAIAELAGSLATPVTRVVGAGGKRLRPALTLAVAGLGQLPQQAAGVLDRAAAVELLHCATLIHDDLLDGAAVRRGAATVNAAEGMGSAVLSGDLLIAAAGVLAGRVSQHAGMVIAQTLASLCRGEALEADARFDVTVTSERLLDVLRLKTGSLTQAACVLGADAAGLPGDVVDGVAEYGMEFGISLQLIDDVIDVVSTPALAGKPVGVDFLAGTVTMPAIFAMQHTPELRSLLRPVLDDISRRRALSLLRSPATVHASVLCAVEHAVTAGEALRAVGHGQPAIEQLAQWPVQYLRSQLDAKTDGSQPGKFLGMRT